MQNKKMIAGIVAAAATVILSVLRVCAAPTLAENGGSMLSFAVVVSIPVIVAVLLLLSPRFPPAPIPSGRSFVSFGALFAGVLSILTAVWTFVRWKTVGEWPFPAPTTPTTLSTAFLLLLCVFALLGGVFFVLQGLSWLRGKPLGTWGSFLSLAPLAWSWVRICQYETSFYSSLDVARHWGDLSALLLEMLFFLLLARFVSKADKPPRRLFGISLCVGVLFTAACVTRTVMALSGNQAALENSGLLAAPDLGVALLAFGVAKAYAPAAEPEKNEPEMAVVPVPSADEEEKEEEIFLITRLPDETPIDNGDEDFEDVPNGPLDLEDMILRLMNNPDDEEK